MSKRKRYTREFKLDAVHIASQEGVSIAQVAREVGINPGSLRRWKREFEADGTLAFPGQGNPRDGELTQLRLLFARHPNESKIVHTANG